VFRYTGNTTSESRSPLPKKGREDGPPKRDGDPSGENRVHFREGTEPPGRVRRRVGRYGKCFALCVDTKALIDTGRLCFAESPRNCVKRTLIKDNK
jgi:hypothetical protein